MTQGVLGVTTGGTLGSGSATVRAGAELRVDGSGVISDFAIKNPSIYYTSSNTITVNGTATSPGLLTVTGSGVIQFQPFIIVGGTGAGVFDSSGRAVGLNGGLQLGNAAGSVGTFNISAGEIRGHDLLVRFSAGTGVARQTGGLVDSDEIRLGDDWTGTYGLSGAGSIPQASGDAYLGYRTGVTGTLTMSGGRLDVVSDLHLGLQG